jgi:integrase
LRFTEPKTARTRRTITLPVSIAATLKQHRTQQRKERLRAGGDWKESGLVFTTQVGTALDARNVHREFKAVLKDCGLPPVRFHDLRHTAATLLLAQGVDPRTIMETLGHSQISLTLNTYSHVVPALQEMAAAKMDAILRES